MRRSLSRLRDKSARLDHGEKGFTLIELLVVVVILGVLIAIAIPLYLNYRKGANDAAAQSDLKNAITVLEQCNADNRTYPVLTATTYTSAAAAVPCANQAIKLSTDTSLIYTGLGVSYTITDNNSSGSGKYYCYASLRGGSVRQSTSASSCLALP